MVCKYPIMVGKLNFISFRNFKKCSLDSGNSIDLNHQSTNEGQFKDPLHYLYVSPWHCGSVYVSHARGNGARVPARTFTNACWHVCKYVDR